MKLSTTDIKIISMLLDLAAEKFSSHGCNDFLLPLNGENYETVKRAELFVYRQQVDVSFSAGSQDICANDSVLMRYYSDMLKNSVTESEQEAVAKLLEEDDE